MHDIASEAGYTAQSLYTYFKGKQEIVDALIATMADELQQAFRAPTPPGLTFPQRFESLLERWVDFGNRWREALSVLFTLKAAAKLGTGHKSGRLGGDFFIERLTAWLQDAATPQDLGGNDPRTLACILKGILYGLFLDWLSSGQDKFPAERIRVVRNIFLHGVSGGAGGHTPASDRTR